MYQDNLFWILNDLKGGSGATQQQPPCTYESFTTARRLKETGFEFTDGTDPTEQDLPSLHIIETDGDHGHTFFYVDSKRILRKYVGGQPWDCSTQADIGEVTLPIAPTSRLTGCITAQTRATFVLFFENRSHELQGVRVRQGRTELLPPIVIAREPDSAFAALSGMDGAINVVYQHRDKHLHRVLIDLETGHSLADTTLRNSRFDEPIVDIMIKEGEDGGFSIYAPLVDRERQEQLDELFKKNPELLNGDKPRAIDGLVAITADGERTELEEERQRIDPNARTMPVGLQTRLIPKQPGAAASSIRAA